MSNILKQYRVAGEDKNVRVINSNSMIKQIFADSISRPADSYTGISSDAQSSLEKTKSLSPDTQESGFNDGINTAVVTELLAGLSPEYEKSVYLVLSATTKYRDLISIIDSYKDIDDYKLIFTKLDETSSYGNLLNIKLYSDAGISYVTNGQNVPDDIEVFDTQKIVKQLLGGRQ